MGLTTAMYTALSGINVNQSRIETIGNNLANVNTTAFKGSRTLFQTQFSQLMSAGNAPSETSGGVNPTQSGLGAVVATTQRIFTPGSIETTGIASDLAVEGNGFFVVRRPNGQQVFTRDGAFTVTPDNRLVTRDGSYVQGFTIDPNFVVQPGALSDLTIPLGTLSIARATQNVRMDGDLSALEPLATQFAETTSAALVDGGGGQAGANTPLADLRAASAPGTALFADGNTIRVSGVAKGDRELTTQTFVVGTDGSTLGDFASWLQTRLGIQTGPDLPGTPGVTIENGQLVIRSNPGYPNAIAIETSDITSDNAGGTVPFSFSQTTTLPASGAYTTFTAYDSLGTPVQINTSYVLDSIAPTGPVWRFYAETPNPSGGSIALGTGTISFDNNGNFLSATGTQLSIDRSATGAITPLVFNMDFSGLHGLSTRDSGITLGDQDGFQPGTLANYSVGSDGVITGAFTNGLTRTLGQVALATFPNPEGLIAEQGNYYVVGPNTGAPVISAPGQFNAGTILSGALELSNVDVSREFIGLISSSAAFQASSRVITVSRDLLDQLLLVVR
ncbi:MAG: flagellar hook-basal body complex protein [Phycisphaerales bacterium]|nr:flagellar hook-basal body complex protein [Phycisphaerales bacterium]